MTSFSTLLALLALAGPADPNTLTLKDEGKPWS
jgi:hypothetical protein